MISKRKARHLRVVRRVLATASVAICAAWVAGIASAVAQTGAPERGARSAGPAGGYAPLSASPSPAVQHWRWGLRQHFHRHIRPPVGFRGRAGVGVFIVIDRSGRILSSKLAPRSGNEALDRAVEAGLRRASPVPPPPAGYGRGSAISLAFPLVFTR